jgi:hypothetical protein
VPQDSSLSGRTEPVLAAVRHCIIYTELNRAEDMFSINTYVISSFFVILYSSGLYVHLLQIHIY